MEGSGLVASGKDGPVITDRRPTHTVAPRPPAGILGKYAWTRPHHEARTAACRLPGATLRAPLGVCATDLREGSPDPRALTDGGSVAARLPHGTREPFEPRPADLHHLPPRGPAGPLGARRTAGVARDGGVRSSTDGSNAACATAPASQLPLPLGQSDNDRLIEPLEGIGSPSAGRQIGGFRPRSTKWHAGLPGTGWDVVPTGGVYPAKSSSGGARAGARTGAAVGRPSTWLLCSSRSRIAVASTSSPASISGQSLMPLLVVMRMLPRP